MTSGDVLNHRQSLQNKKFRALSAAAFDMETFENVAAITEVYFVAIPTSLQGPHCTLEAHMPLTKCRRMHTSSNAFAEAYVVPLDRPNNAEVEDVTVNQAKLSVRGRPNASQTEITTPWGGQGCASDGIGVWARH